MTKTLLDMVKEHNEEIDKKIAEESAINYDKMVKKDYEQMVQYIKDGISGTFAIFSHRQEVKYGIGKTSFLDIVRDREVDEREYSELREYIYKNDPMLFDTLEIFYDPKYETLRWRVDYTKLYNALISTKKENKTEIDPNLPEWLKIAINKDYASAIGSPYNGDSITDYIMDNYVIANYKEDEKIEIPSDGIKIDVNSEIEVFGRLGFALVYWAANTKNVGLIDAKTEEKDFISQNTYIQHDYSLNIY